jgi:hypothetical protein
MPLATRGGSPLTNRSDDPDSVFPRRGRRVQETQPKEVTMSRLQWTLVSIAMLLMPRAAPAQESGAREILNRLASQKIDVDFDHMPLEEALQYIRGMTGTNIVLSKNAREGHEADVVSLKFKQVNVKTVLRIMLGERNLTLVYREGLIQVVPIETACRPVTKVYDVKDLVTGIRSFPGPRVDLIPPTGGGDLFPGVILSFDEEKTPTLTTDFLEKMIQDSTGAGGRAWTENPANVKINRPASCLLVITQTEKVHQEIADLLRLLRQYR